MSITNEAFEMSVISKSTSPTGLSQPGVAINPPISTRDLISWSFQIARGMDYLANIKSYMIEQACQRRQCQLVNKPRFLVVGPHHEEEF